MKKTLIAAALAGSALLSAGAANAATTGLALVLDESGSISSSDWTLQVSAYANVLGGSVIPLDGSLYIGVWKFDDTVEQVFAPAAITAANQASLVAAINGMVQDGGLTAIGDGIAAAVAGFSALTGVTFDRLVVDVSTDGFNNFGQSPVTASANALAAGFYAVNCLGIGAGADCSWNPGAPSFDVTATFQTLQTALEDKILRETQIPEPASIALLGLGLLGLGALRRKMSA